jgi:hypothetical protein
MCPAGWDGPGIAMWDNPLQSMAPKIVEPEEARPH